MCELNSNSRWIRKKELSPCVYLWSNIMELMARRTTITKKFVIFQYHVHGLSNTKYADIEVIWDEWWVQYIKKDWKYLNLCHSCLTFYLAMVIKTTWDTAKTMVDILACQSKPLAMKKQILLNNFFLFVNSMVPFHCRHQSTSCLITCFINCKSLSCRCAFWKFIFGVSYHWSGMRAPV